MIVATTASLIAGPACEAICVNHTGQRIPDHHCDNTTNTTTSDWYYYRTDAGARGRRNHHPRRIRLLQPGKVSKLINQPSTRRAHHRR